MRLPEVLNAPSMLEEEYAFYSALWFFQRNKLFQLADDGVSDEIIKIITRRVNGGYHGLDDRKEQTKKIYGWLT